MARPDGTHDGHGIEAGVRPRHALEHGGQLALERGPVIHG
jgi:hypothetical protein